MNLESTLNNVVQGVSFLTVIEVIATGDVYVFLSAQGIAARFCVGGVIGALFGLFCLNAGAHAPLPNLCTVTKIGLDLEVVP